MSLQHTHNTTPFNNRKHPIVILCDGLQSPANIGSLFRISEAFGIEKIVFCNTSVNFQSSRLQRTARNTDKIVNYKVSDDIVSEIKTHQNDGYRILALEITNNSIPLERYKHKETTKKVLILGNERTGISDEVLGLASDVIHINMFGENSSMNVIQAASIALYSLTKN